MRSIKYVLLVVMAIYSAALSGENKNASPPTNRLLNVADMVQIVSEFNTILNHKVPMQSDFDQLYPAGAGAGDREQYIEQKYCKELKLEYDTEECSKRFRSLLESYKNDIGAKNPSFYLINIRNILTDSKDAHVELYLDSNTSACSKADLNEHKYISLNTIAAIGNSKFKKLIVSVPCYSQDRDEWAHINVLEIDSKSLDSYPVHLERPEKSK